MKQDSLIINGKDLSIIEICKPSPVTISVNYKWIIEELQRRLNKPLAEDIKKCLIEMDIDQEIIKA